MAALRLLQLSEGPRNFQALHLVSEYIINNPTQRAVRLASKTLLALVVLAVAALLLIAIVHTHV